VNPRLNHFPFLKIRKSRLENSELVPISSFAFPYVDNVYYGSVHARLYFIFCQGRNPKRVSISVKEFGAVTCRSWRHFACAVKLQMCFSQSNSVSSWYLFFQFRNGRILRIFEHLEILINGVLCSSWCCFANTLSLASRSFKLRHAANIRHFKYVRTRAAELRISPPSLLDCVTHTLLWN